MPKLLHALNQPVIVGSPGYFGDDVPRQLFLVDVEEQGLWFSGAALHAPGPHQVLTPLPDDAAAVIFLPFAQITFLFDPHQYARLAEGLRHADQTLDHPVLARAAIILPGAPVSHAENGTSSTSKVSAPRPGSTRHTKRRS